MRNSSRCRSFLERSDVKLPRRWILESPRSKPLNINDQLNSIEQIRFIPQRINEKKFSSHEKSFSSARKEKYSWKEKRNVIIYILGLMFYKFGLEAFNGSIISLATNRFDLDAQRMGLKAKTFEQIGLIVGLNQLFQCIGSILISPLTQYFSTRLILSISILIFGFFSALLLIIDASTGGKLKPSSLNDENNLSYYGNYPTHLLIPIYCLTGISYGMVELIRRILPQDLLGNDEEKLKEVDSIVHIFYEISGVSGALLTGLVLIPRLGNNYSFLITPILFTCAALIWFCLRIKKEIKSKKKKKKKKKKKIRSNPFKSLINAFLLFGQSIVFGAQLIFSRRKYIWLFPCYTLTLYIHRYLENGIAPQLAQRYLLNSQWSQIIVGGSNLGELFGALAVLLFSRRIRSPIFWLRMDSFLLLFSWSLPFLRLSSNSIRSAFYFALIYFPFGFGGSCDDVSLNAHLQSVLNQSQAKKKHLSPLSCVMSFLYSFYIILYAVLNPLLGKYIDHIHSTRGTIAPALLFTASTQISIVSLIVFLCTFIPRGSFKFNPRLK